MRYVVYRLSDGVIVLDFTGLLETLLFNLGTEKGYLQIDFGTDIKNKKVINGVLV
jgi:hypothetical protein